MNYPNKGDRVQLSTDALENIAEIYSAYDTVMNDHLRVLESAIMEFALENPAANRLLDLIKKRAETWMPGQALYFSDAIYDRLYPPAKEDSLGVTEKFLVTSLTALFKDSNGEWTNSKEFAAVSADQACHLAALEVAGDPKKYPSGDAFHKEYMRARGSMSTRWARAADSGTSAQDIMRAASV